MPCCQFMFLNMRWTEESILFVDSQRGCLIFVQSRPCGNPCRLLYVVQLLYTLGFTGCPGITLLRTTQVLGRLAMIVSKEGTLLIHSMWPGSGRHLKQRHGDLSHQSTKYWFWLIWKWHSMRRMHVQNGRQGLWQLQRRNSGLSLRLAQ